jgi:hypothetical protein
MVSMLASSVVDCGFKPRLDQTNWYLLLLRYMQHYGNRTETDWLGIRIMCQSEADCCFSELPL